MSAPKNFPSGQAVMIEKGIGLAEISGKLKEAGLVRSKYAFALYARAFGKSKKIKYGKYLFNEPVSVFTLTSRLAKGEFGFKPVKVVIPEGLTVKEIAELFIAFENFDKKNFWKKQRIWKAIYSRTLICFCLARKQTRLSGRWKTILKIRSAVSRKTLSLWRL